MATTKRKFHEVTDSSLLTSKYGGALAAFKGKNGLSDKTIIGLYEDWGNKVILDL